MINEFIFVISCPSFNDVIWFLILFKRNEDPNLLNVPELLYKEAAKLPPPSVNGSFLEVLNMTSELMQSHNVALVSKLRQN